MDFKKLIADLAARYRKVSEPIFSSSLAPPGQVVDVDAAHEAGRKAGYEAGYKKGYDEDSVSHETYTNTPQTTCATHRAIAGLSRHTPSDLMTKSAAWNLCDCTNSRMQRSTFGRSGSIISKTNAADPSRPSCMIPSVGSSSSMTLFL